NANTDFIPAASAFKMFLTIPEDSISSSQHPWLRYLDQQKIISEAKYRLEKSKLAPDLFIAYNNMSMKGTGADSKTYTSSTRFNSAQAGIGIPIFMGAQR